MSLDLESIIDRYLDGTISEAEMAQLNEHLSSENEAREMFVEWMNLDSAISALAEGYTEDEEGASSSLRKPDPAPFRATLFRGLAVAACLALLAGGVWWWQATQQAFATVVKSAGVQELTPGASLHQKDYAIRAGTLELVTARKANIIIEAPAEFRFESAQRLHVRKGRLSADVPPSAKGFTVITPSGNAVDLGTRFGVDVPTSGAVEVHVFEGEVITKAAGETTQQSLLTGDAIAMNDGASTARELRSSAFIQRDEIVDLSAGLAAGQQAFSDAALTKLKQDPALIALIDFESETPHAGVFRTVQGRWPGSSAAEFVNVVDHLKLDVGGEREWPQLTLAAWVRLDHLGAPYQSLLHTNGWNRENPGQVHWMVTSHMTMRLALFGNTLAPGSDETERYPDSRTSVLPEQGRWVHLATTYDSEARTVRFFLNGQLDKVTHQAIAHPAKLGPAQIGNWDQGDRKLSGRVDELLLLGRAMSTAEVSELYQAGNPYD